MQEGSGEEMDLSICKKREGAGQERKMERQACHAAFVEKLTQRAEGGPKILHHVI